jgi:hypothetical protein
VLSNQHGLRWLFLLMRPLHQKVKHQSWFFLQPLAKSQVKTNERESTLAKRRAKSS